MLNKEICKQCLDILTGNAWDEAHEQHWKERIMFCLHGKFPLGRWINTNEPPPKKCPYSLEHIVSNQNAE